MSCYFYQEKRKKGGRRGIFFGIFFGLFLFFCGKGSNVQAASNVLHLYKGQTIGLVELLKQEGSGIDQLVSKHGKNVMLCQSQDPDVIFVSGDRKLTARKCGKTSLVLRIETQEEELEKAIDIRVSYSRFFKDGALELKIPKTELDQYFSESAFVGNSVSLGLTYYMQAQPEGFMGEPVMLTAGCYSFYNDENGDQKYRIHYKGQVYTAREAIKKSGVRRAFICMGTNDIGAGPEQCFKNYVAYLNKIRRVNPELTIFIEAATPVCNGNGHVNNVYMDQLNEKMKAYCETKKNMYYIDINTPLKSGSRMDPRYCSDGYVHVNTAGYEVWCRVVRNYVEKMLLREQTAEDAVETALESGREKDVLRSEARIQKLLDSGLKKELKQRLKSLGETEKR